MVPMLTCGLLRSNFAFDIATPCVLFSEMFGYSTYLRSRTQGRATYSMQFHSYQQVPAVVAEEIIKRVRGE